MYLNFIQTDSRSMFSGTCYFHSVHLADIYSYFLHAAEWYSIFKYGDLFTVLLPVFGVLIAGVAAMRTLELLRASLSVCPEACGVELPHCSPRSLVVGSQDVSIFELLTANSFPNQS